MELKGREFRRGRRAEWEVKQVRQGQAADLTLCDQPLKRLSPSGRYKFYEFWPRHTGAEAAAGAGAGAEAGEVDENELIPAVHAFMNTHSHTQPHTDTHIHTHLLIYSVIDIVSAHFLSFLYSYFASFPFYFCIHKTQ